LRSPKRNEINGARRSTSKLIRRFAIRGLWGFLALLVIEYFVLPQIAGARKALTLVSHANYALVFGGVILEALALFAYAKLTAAMLPRNRPSTWTLLRIDLASLSVSHVLPGGTASGSGLALRLLTNAGVRGTDAAFAIATQGIGSAVVLNIILWVSLIVSIPFAGFNSLYLVVALLGIVLLAIISALIYLFTKGQERAVLIADSLTHRIPLLRKFDLRGSVRRIAQRISDLRADPQVLRNGITWASINWLADAACLWVMLAGFGKWINPVSLLVAYTIANVMAVLPITPAGLGVIEAFATLALVKFFGVPRGIAILGVIAWRLFNFWLPIPAGVAGYISLRISSGVPPEEVTMELDRLDFDPPPEG
jgi:uncharacterized protein (TIRG00374 family)